MVKHSIKHKKKKFHPRKPTRKHRNKTTHRKKIFLIKNNTPIPIQILSKAINREIDREIDISETPNHTSVLKSYSPLINKALVSLTKTDANKILICGNNFLTINIGTENKPLCVNYNDPRSKELFLQNLKNPTIDCGAIIPPKQFLSNCWFNTMFITFFISDKGRKFFKFFRQLMIEGKDSKGNVIPTELAKAFFIFNLAIESTQNNLLKGVAYLLNTNLLIQKIHNAIRNNYGERKYKKSLRISSKIIDIGDAGNPIDYYETIMNYLNNDSLNINSVSADKSADEKFISSKINFSNVKHIPDIIILEIYDNGIDGPGYSEKVNNKKNHLVFNGKHQNEKIEYELDSVIIRDTTGEHFSSLLMCNKNEYAFDGASYNRMTKFAWKENINKNKNWGFEGHDLKWNFMNAYQILFYYRV
jgi:hypothetical protein